MHHAVRPTLALLSLLVTSPAAASSVPAHVQAALERSLGVSDGRLVTQDWKASLPRGCQTTDATVERPLHRSGKVPVKLTGAGCTGWGWATVQVFAPVLVTTRALMAGERLDGAVELVERELSGREADARSAAGAVAARPIPRGAVVTPNQVRVDGPRTGEPVKVLLLSGALAVEAQGRVVPCTRGRSCAVLPSGKHLEGRMEAGRLVVEVP